MQDVNIHKIMFLLFIMGAATGCVRLPDQNSSPRSPVIEEVNEPHS